jgi:hypothetical protein
MQIISAYIHITTRSEIRDQIGHVLQFPRRWGLASGGLGGAATERWRGVGRVTHAGAFMAAAGALCPDRRWRGLDLGTI